MIVHKVLFGSVLSLGDYQDDLWNWSAPWRWDVLFSSDHGLFSWTPILCLAVIGLLMWGKTNRLVAGLLAGQRAQLLLPNRIVSSVGWLVVFWIAILSLDHPDFCVRLDGIL